jgi:hypothetical protein
MASSSGNMETHPSVEALQAELYSLRVKYSEALKKGDTIVAEEIFIRIKEIDKHLFQQLDQAGLR